MDIEVMLNDEEQAELDKCETVIKLGLNTFFKVGEALAAIRDNHLYRRDYPTFESYCNNKWGIVASRARQLIGASETVKVIESVTNGNTLSPKNERQLRPLTGLAKEDKIQAWTNAVTSASGLPTSEQVAAAAQPFKPKHKPAPPQPGSAPATLEATATAPKPVKLDGVTKEQVDKAFSLLRLFVVSGYKEFFVSEARKLLKETGKL